MVKDLISKFNLITNVLILVILLFGGFIWADSNGVWTLAEDIRPGVFGSDEGTGDYIFESDVFFEFAKVSNQTWSQEYCDEIGNNCKNISDMGSYKGIRCGAGEQLVGFDSNGDLICEIVYTYTWNGLGDWGTCTPISGTCGAGLQTQTVECIRNDGVTVANSYCDATSNPESRSCNVACNFALGKSYTISPTTSCHHVCHSDSGGELTNGIYGGWELGWLYTGTTIILDLGFQYTIKNPKLYVYDGDGAAGVDNPPYVDFYVSSDGSSYTYLGRDSSMSVRSGASKYFEIDRSTSPISNIRYVKYVVPQSINSWLMVEEIEVFG